MQNSTFMNQPTSLKAFHDLFQFCVTPILLYQVPERIQIVAQCLILRVIFLFKVSHPFKKISTCAVETKLNTELIDAKGVLNHPS